MVTSLYIKTCKITKSSLLWIDTSKVLFVFTNCLRKSSIFFGCFMFWGTRFPSSMVSSMCFSGMYSVNFIIYVCGHFLSQLPFPTQELSVAREIVKGRGRPGKLGPTLLARLGRMNSIRAKWRFYEIKLRGLKSGEEKWGKKK